MVRYFKISKDSWINGVSDGLVLPCSICGTKNILFDYIVKDDLWNQIVPKSMRSAVVCLPCLDKLAKKAQLNLGEYIESIQFTGINETIEFIPSNVFMYGEKSDE